MSDDKEFSASQRCRELISSISPTGMYNVPNIDEAGKLLLRRAQYDKGEMNEFAQRLLGLLSSLQFPYHDTRAGAQLEMHLRTMAIATHTLQDSLDEFKMAKDQREQLYKSVMKFRDLCEKQDGGKNPNVAFKLSEIRNGLEMIKDDRSVAADFSNRFINLCKGAQALWTHDYMSAMNAFLVAFDFELPVGHWYAAWVEIRALHYIFAQLRDCPEFDEVHAVAVLRVLCDKLKETVTNTKSKSAAMKQFTKLGNMIALSTGTGSFDLPETLALGILDTIQDVVQVSRRGNVGADCLDVLKLILTSKSSTKMLRYKALEVLFVIRNHPGTNVEVLKNIDMISVEFDNLIHQRTESDAEKEKNVSLRRHVQTKLNEDNKLRRLIISEVEEVSQHATGNNSTDSMAMLKNLSKNLRKHLANTKDMQSSRNDNVPTTQPEKCKGELSKSAESLGSKNIPKISPRRALLDCHHSPTITLEDWKNGSIICSCRLKSHLNVWVAARLGDVVGLTYFLDTGTDVNVISLDGAHTLLENVILWCPEPVPAMNLLLDRGAKVDTTHIFTASNYLTEEELSWHAIFEPTDLEGATLLQLASISHKPIDVIRILLKHGADVTVTDKNNQTALFYFARFCEEPLRPMVGLVNCGIPLDTRSSLGGRTALLMAASYCDDQFAAIQFLVNVGVNIRVVDEENSNLLHYVCRYPRSIEALRFTLEHCRLDVNTPTLKGVRCLDLLLCNDSGFLAQSLKMLLDCGYDIHSQDSDGRTCVHYAADNSRNTSSDFKLLSGAGADVNKIDNRGYTALHYLCRNTWSIDCIQSLNLLIESGVDVNISNELGYTALHLACWFLPNPRSVIEALVKAGARPKRSNQDETALHLILDNTETEVSMVPAVQYLLDAGWLMAPTANKTTSLHCAARTTITFDTVPKFKVLLDNLADINATDEYKRTGLHTLLLNNSQADVLEPIKFLIANGASVNVAEEKGWTPVLIAATYAADPIVILSVLKEAGADFTATTKTNLTVLHQLVLNENCQDLASTFANFLKLDVLVDINTAEENGYTALIYVAALARDPLPLLKSLVETGADPLASTNRQRTVLHEFIINNIEANDLMDTARYLLEKGVPVSAADWEGFTALHRVAQSSKDPNTLFKLLLDCGADVSEATSENVSALHYIWQNENCGDVVSHARFLLEHGAQVNSTNLNKYTPMHFCARHYFDPASGFQLLIDFGADVNAVSSMGETVLHVLSSNERCTDLYMPAKILIDAGINIEAQSVNGFTVLHKVALANNDPLDCIGMLLNHGADAKAVTSYGYTALHLLLCKYTTGALEAIPKLVQAGCPVDSMDNGKYTPLFYAAQVQADPLPIMRLLVNLGADPTATGKDGHGIHHRIITNTRCADLIGVLENLMVPYQPNAKDLDGNTPTHWACSIRDDTKLIEWMIVHGGDAGVVWKYVEESKADYNGDRDGLVDAILAQKVAIVDFLLERHLCNPLLSVLALQWYKSTVAAEREYSTIDELMARLVVAMEEWGPKSEEDKETTDVEASSTRVEVKTDVKNEEDSI